MDSLYPHAQDGNPNTKRCSKCKQFFPATTEFFFRYKKGEEALRPNCKQCAHNTTRMLPPAGTMKDCTVCHQSFPATTEFFHSNGKSGLYTQCKECVNEKNKAAYLNPDVQEQVRARGKAYRQRPENREKIQASYKAWRERPSSREHLRSYTRTFRNRPEVREQRRTEAQKYMSRPEVREQRLERERAYLKRPEIRDRRRARDRVNQHARRSRKRAIQGTCTPEQIQDLLKRQKRKCYYCGDKFEKKQGKYIYHVDHTFPLSRVAGTDIPANDISYLVLTCPTCNLKKNDKFPWEWPEGGKLL